MQVEVRVERYADQGRCVGHVDGRVVFIRFALPGELVRVTLDEPSNRKDRFWTGEVSEVLEASAHRVTPPWQLAGALAQGGGVGGADLIHVDLLGQLAWKSAVITEQMERLGHVTLAPVHVERITGDEALGGLHWRTRIELNADARGRLAMRRRESHDLVPVNDMPLATRALLAVMHQHELWQREFEPLAQVRVVVPQPRVAGVDELPPAQLLQAVGDNYAISVNDVVQAGNAELDELATIGDHTYRFQVAASGFWQIHRMAPCVLPTYAMSVIHETLAERGMAEHRLCIWDLYSGSGLFTAPLAKEFPESNVFAVEGSKLAVAHARSNMRSLQCQRVTELASDVARALAHVPKPFQRPDVVLLDPPRAGAGAQVVQRIAQAEASIVVYVACSATSLARDTATLQEAGYHLHSIRAFDIYPMTHHVETIAIFTR